MKRSVRLTNPDDQTMAAHYFITHGGIRNRTLACAITVTGKRARKLIKNARRVVRERNNVPVRADVTATLSV